MCLEHAECAVFKLCDEHGAVVDINRAAWRVGAGLCGQALHLLYERAAGDKGFLQSHDGFELAAQIARKVNKVRSQVAQRARTADIALQSPDKRELGVDYKVCGKVRTCLIVLSCLRR